MTIILNGYADYASVHVFVLKFGIEMNAGRVYGVQVN